MLVHHRMPNAILSHCDADPCAGKVCASPGSCEQNPGSCNSATGACAYPAAAPGVACQLSDGRQGTCDGQKTCNPGVGWICCALTDPRPCCNSCAWHVWNQNRLATNMPLILLHGRHATVAASRKPTACAQFGAACQGRSPAAPPRALPPWRSGPVICTLACDLFVTRSHHVLHCVPFCRIWC